MSQPEQQQQFDPIFTPENPHIVKGWQKIVAKKNLKQISTQQMGQLMKYVFEKSKDELEMELDPETNFLEMVEDYKQAIDQKDKDKFSFDEAVEVLNWAVDPGDDQEQQQQQLENTKQQNQPVQNEKQKTVQKPQEPQNQQNLQQATNNQPKQAQLTQKKHTTEKYQSQVEKEQQRNDQRQNTSQNQAQQAQQNENLRQQSKQPSLINQKPHQQAKQHKSPRQKESEHRQEHSNREKLNLSNNRPQANEDDQMDWGNTSKPQQQSKHSKLYKQINSYQEKQKPITFYNPTEQPQQSIQNLKQQPTSPYHQPLSIKRSLAKLSQQQHQKSLKPQHKPLPVLKLLPQAPQTKYIKKMKLVIKNKKAKPEYHMQAVGLKQLFKFYCGLNSEFYNISKHKDPAKGTFDELNSRVTNLYLHNFMLFCKDFNLIDTKAVSKPTLKTKAIKRPQNNTKDSNQQENPSKRRNSKGSVPQSSFQNINQMNQPKKSTKSSEIKSKQSEEIWDRDKLSNYFKKEADYTLNVKFDKFIEILKTVLSNKLEIVDQINEEKQEDKKQQEIKHAVKQQSIQNKAKQERQARQEGNQQEELEKEDMNQSQPTQNNQIQDKSAQIQQSQPQKTKVTPKVQPITLALCKLLKIDTQPNYESTMQRLKILYKILQPQPAKVQQKKTVRQMNGHFQENIAQQLKNRQLQKQQQRIQIKEKYLNKYSAPQVDIYSSFKKATNQVNSQNGLYGSGPKLNATQKQAKLNGTIEQTYTVTAPVQISTQLYNKKKLSKQYQLGSIIKEARSELFQSTKQNPRHPNYHLKQPALTQNLSRSRFSPLTSNQQASKPLLGYKKLHQLHSKKPQEQTLSSILLNNSRLVEQQAKTNRSNRNKMKSKDISSPLLQRIGCHQDDDLLNRYFDQEKSIERHKLNNNTMIR